MNIDMKSIGERIKKRRIELNLTQTDIHKECGISSGNLSELENGNRTPALLTLYKLSRVLKSSIDWIVSGESPTSESLLISDEEELLLSGFRDLSPDDREELIDIMELKLKKVKKAKDQYSRSSDLTATKESKLA